MSKTSYLMAEKILAIEGKLTKKLAAHTFVSAGIKTVYNPLVYAAEPHEDYIRKYVNSTKRVLFLGMNPGPFGMAQNGVPFGEIQIVKNWLKIRGKVIPPKDQNPNRPIEGMDVRRSEVSGQRLWGMFKEIAGTPEAFFENCVVYNYCPLAFIAGSGKNVAPNDLSPMEKKKLIKLCDETMSEIIKLLQCEVVVGVGKFAEERINTIKREYKLNYRVLSIPHPSPLNARANTNYIGNVTALLKSQGLLEFINNKKPKKSSALLELFAKSAKKKEGTTDSAKNDVKGDSKNDNSSAIAEI